MVTIWMPWLPMPETDALIASQLEEAGRMVGRSDGSFVAEYFPSAEAATSFRLVISFPGPPRLDSGTWPEPTNAELEMGVYEDLD